MKKFVSSLLIFSIVFTGAAATSCFAVESYQADYKVTNGAVPLNFNIEITAQGGSAKAESKAEASANSNSSKRSKIAAIAKIILIISIILTVKKYSNITFGKLQSMIDELKTMLKDLPKNVSEKVAPMVEKLNVSSGGESQSFLSRTLESLRGLFKSELNSSRETIKAGTSIPPAGNLI